MGSRCQNGANSGRKCGSDCLTVVSFVAENAGYPKVPVSLLARTSSSVSRQRDVSFGARDVTVFGRLSSYFDQNTVTGSYFRRVQRDA